MSPVLDASSPQTRLHKSVVGLIAFEILLAVTYLISSVATGSVAPALDFNGMRSLPSLLQALHLILISLAAFSLIFLRSRLARPVSWRLIFSVLAVFIYAAIDEVTKLHLRLNQYNWKLIYVGVAIAIPVVCYRDFLMLWRFHRRSVLLTAMGMIIFITGGIGAEILKVQVLLPLVAHQDASMLFIAEKIRVTIEELSELLGETLTLYGVTLFLIQSLRKIE